MKVEICNLKTKEVITELNDVSLHTSIEEIKEMFADRTKHPVERQSLRSDPRGKSVSDSSTLRSLGFDGTATLFFKDLGPQIGWKTVFLAEYAGPFFVYLLFYLRPSFIYGVSNLSMTKEAKIVCACWLFHYGKRLFETQFVHRFSNGTMPWFNIVKNCGYYWGFTGLIAYFTNHPLYTPASYGDIQVYLSLFGFAFCELGNLSIHILQRNLRPAGSKVRKVPLPTSNPFTWLFSLVSCPNYTYEFGAWFCFTVLSQTLTAGLFTFAGFYQMAVWAIKKHKNYRKEFKDYPKGRKSILPFIL